MAYLIVRHTVEDYAKWKPVFDEHLPVRKSHSVVYEQVFRSVDNPNEITLLFEVSDLKLAREFTETSDLKSVMERAGVIGMPSITFLEEVETRELVKTSM